MSVIINPGSEIKGGTIEQAKKNALKWLKSIYENGFKEVIMSEGKEIDGRFTFQFTHPITGVSVDLDIHGFTAEECNDFIFSPRVYWNGSSTGDEKIEDWLKDGYSYRIEYFKD